MIYRNAFQWGLALLLGGSLLSGCGGASPTPIDPIPIETSAAAPVLPPAVQPITTDVPPTPQPTNTPPAPAAGDLTTTPGGTPTLTPSPTAADPFELPFLMQIDRISVVVGRGTLLEGRVAHGTLQGNSSVEILGPQNQVISTSVLAVLISGTVRDRVTVGDYAGILVESTGTSGLSPGMLLSEAGAYDSYEEAHQALR